MSVVFGIYHKKNNPIEDRAASDMQAPLGSIPFDRLDVLKKYGACFGCGHQYNTPESVFEVLPRYDAEKELMITADAVIDNRQELFRIFAIDRGRQNQMSDSELIVLAYRKWGVDCPKYLVGNFTFVIRDFKENVLYGARDHVGKRTFYYYESGDLFAFATLLKPLLPLLGDPKLNERWITDFLAMESIIHETECTETVFEQIYQLPPAYWMRIEDGTVTKKQYWEPAQEVRPLILKTDAEYEEAFRQVLTEAVACRLRSIGEIGISLSGGLDSGSIAALAAPLLAKENKKLYALSSIPLKEFTDDPGGGYVNDESGNIQALIDYVGNIEGEFLRNEGKYALTDADQIIDRLEQPYKIYRNMPWLNAFHDLCAQKGCKVLLTGGYGNMTISFGSYAMYYKTLFNKGRFISLSREIRAVSKMYRAPIGGIAKKVFDDVMPYFLKDLLNARRLKEWEPFDHSVVNPDLVRKWDVEKRFKPLGLNLRTFRLSDSETFRWSRVNPVLLSHMAAIEVKQSVYRGITRRDPSRDKRVIEFCLSVPDDQLVRNGQNRFLIRRAMKGVLPDQLRLGYTAGVQGADWLLRLKPHWQSILEELEEAVREDAIREYFDLTKIKREMNAVKQGVEEISSISAQKLLTTVIFFRFIQWHKKISK